MNIFSLIVSDYFQALSSSNTAEKEIFKHHITYREIYHFYALLDICRYVPN